MDVGGPVMDGEGRDNAEFDRMLNTDDALCYVMCLMFDRFHSVIANCNLYLD